MIESHGSKVSDHVNKLHLYGAISLCNMGLLICIVIAYLTSIKPEDVYSSINVNHAELVARIENNSEKLTELQQTLAGTKREINTLNKTLSSFYQSLVRLIEVNHAEVTKVEPTPDP